MVLQIVTLASDLMYSEFLVILVCNEIVIKLKERALHKFVNKLLSIIFIKVLTT